MTSLSNINTPSSIGRGSAAGSAADLVLASGNGPYATLSYNGATAISTNRLFTIGDAVGYAAAIRNDSAAASSTMSFTSTGSIAFGPTGGISTQLAFMGTNTGNNTFAPIIGDGSFKTYVQKYDTGTWIITGANTYTGGTTVYDGTLTVNSGGTLGASTATLTVGVGFSGYNPVLNLNVDQTVSSLTGSVAAPGTATINIGSGKTLTVNQTANTTYQGVIASAGSLTKSGTGTLTLSGLNTYAGATTINGGTVWVTTLANVNTASSIGKGSVAGSAGDLVFGATSQAILDYTGAAVASTNRLFTIGAGALATISADGGGLSFTGTGAIAFTGSGTRELRLIGGSTGNFAPVLGNGPGGATSLSKYSSGTWTLTGANTYSGGTDVEVGTLTVNPGGTLGSSTGSLTVSNVFNNTTVLNLNVDQTVGSLQGTISGSGTLTINIASGKTLTVNQSSNTTYQGLIASTGLLTKSGIGTLTLTGANSYGGVTTIDGGILKAGALANGGSNSAIGASSNAASNLVFGGSTLQYTGSAATVSTDRLFTIGDANGLSATIDSSGTLGPLSFTNGGALAYGGSGARTLTLTGSNTGNNSFSPIIADGTGGATSVVKSGASVWVLSGNNSYTGGTAVSAGLLKAGTTTALGSSSGTLTMNGGNFDLNGNNIGVGNLTGVSGTNIWNNSVNNAVTFTVGNNNTGGGSYAGLIKDNNGASAGTLA